jgi:hypothetical protein
MNNGYQSDFVPETFSGSGSPVSGMIAKSVEPTPPMQSEMRNLERSIKRLDQALSQLAGRVEPVCRVEPPSTLNGAQEARPRAASGLGSQIGAASDQIEGLTQRVNGLLQRCEL